MPQAGRPTIMRVLLLVTVLLLAGCGQESGSSGSDPADDSAPGSSRPDAIPAAPGEVRTRGVVTVMDNGRPEVCLGPVAESWPPQCGGPPLVGWSWRSRRLELGQPSSPGWEQQGAIRWGQYALAGRWDGTSLTVSTAVPAALYDAGVPEEPAAPRPARDVTESELDSIAQEVGSTLPGAQGAYAADGQVFVDVVYDDGSLQTWTDEQYGENVVIVTSALVDV